MAASDQSGDDDEYYEVDDLEEIHSSIVNNDIEQLREACEADADVNEKFTEDIDQSHAGMTPLALASALNRLEHVKMLLDFRADVNDTFAALQTTALMTSSFHGHEKIVKLLLRRGANSRAVDMQGSTALGYAFGGSRSIDVVKMLISAGVDVNQKNMLGMNALLLVAGYGNDTLVRLVLQAGADPNAVNDFGHSALHLAVVGKRSQVAALSANRGATSLYGLNRRDIDQLLKDWCASHRDMFNNRTPDNFQLENIGKFMMAIGQKLDEPDAISQDDQEAMKRRIEAVWRYRDERLQAARDNKKPGVVDTFLSCGGKRSKQVKGKTADTMANAPINLRPVENKPTSPEVDRDVCALSERCALIMRDVLDAGCLVDKTENTFGMTALDMAVLMGDVESTAQLLAAGADPDHLLKLFGLTDLYEISVIHPDKKKLRELLAEDDKIDLNQPYATFNITKAAEPQTTTQTTESGGDEGLMPVAAASKGSSNDSIEIVKMLVKKGAQINKIGPGGRSALAEACRTENNVKMIQSLVSQGADIELPNPFYKNATPVVVAVIHKNPKVVQHLIDKGAKVDKQLTDGRTSVVKAMENKDMPMIDILLAADKDQNFADKSSFVYQMADLYQRDDRDIEKILRTINEKMLTLQRQDEEQAERDQAAKLAQNANNIAPPTTNTAAVQMRNSQAMYAVPSKNQKSRPNQPPPRQNRVESDEESEEEDEEDAPPVPPAPKKVSKKPSKQPEPQPQMRNKAPQAQQRQSSQKQQKPQYHPPPPPQEPSEDEEETESESEEATPPPAKPQPQARVVQQARQPQPRQQQPRQAQQQQQPRQAQQRVPQQPKPQSRQPPPPPESSEEETESEEEEEELPPAQPVKARQTKQQPPKHQPVPVVATKPHVQPKPPTQQKPQSRPPPPPQQQSDEEECEEEESEEDNMPPPPQVPVKKPGGGPPISARQAAPPRATTRPPPQQNKPSLTSSPPPPLPATRPPDDSSEEEEESEEESDDEPPPPPQHPAPPPSSRRPPPAVVNNHHTTTTTTRTVKGPGGSTVDSTTTKTVKSMNQRGAPPSQPSRAQPEEFDSESETESEEEEESDEESQPVPARHAVNNRPPNKYQQPVPVQRPHNRRPVMSAETDI